MPACLSRALAMNATCSCPTPGRNGCPAWCTRRAAWSCRPFSGCAGWCAEHCAHRCCESAEWLKQKLHANGLAAFADAAGAHVEPARRQRPAAERIRRVMVWQGERNDDGHLSFMCCVPRPARSPRSATTAAARSAAHRVYGGRLAGDGHPAERLPCVRRLITAEGGGRRGPDARVSAAGSKRSSPSCLWHQRLIERCVRPCVAARRPAARRLVCVGGDQRALLAAVVAAGPARRAAHLLPDGARALHAREA